MGAKASDQTSNVMYTNPHMAQLVKKTNKKPQHNTLLTICAKCVLGEVKTHCSRQSQFNTCFLVSDCPFQANNKPEHANFDFTSSTFSPLKQQNGGVGSLHHPTTKYYSLMGELPATTVILAVNALTYPTPHREA